MIDPERGPTSSAVHPAVARAVLHRPRRIGLVDLAIVVALAGVLYGLIGLSAEWTGASRAVEIDLSPAALPKYALFSLSRGLIAYGISLVFTLVYGFWAAKDHRAERILVPLLDILQSIPVLGFMPGLVLALVAVFPHSNIGLELAAVIMIFTGQAWNMTFSFYHSLRSVPADMREVAASFRFDWWQQLRWVELPFATIGLVWNSMMSMAGGWFFLMINEAFRLGNRDFRLPGIGSYMSVAVDRGRGDAMIYALIAMTVMIVTVDQVLWRPVVVWAQKFRVEEGGQQEIATSWFLDVLRRSRLLRMIRRRTRRGARRRRRPARAVPASGGTAISPIASIAPVVLLTLLLAVLGIGAIKLTALLRHVNGREWKDLGIDGLWTLGRVLLATVAGTLWALPAGLAIGLSPRLARILQPVVQVVASFPAPMLFPLVIAALAWLGVSLNWGAVVLMLLGTQWYVLFNVIAGATAIPADLQEAARAYRFTRWQRFRSVYLPAVFPYLVTGWVTAAGGAWNASIVAEYVTFKGQTLRAAGIGAAISAAAAHANFPLLAAAIVLMSLIVVTFNRTVWHRCYQLAETRFSLNK